MWAGENVIGRELHCLSQGERRAWDLGMQTTFSVVPIHGSEDEEAPRLIFLGCEPGLIPSARVPEPPIRHRQYLPVPRSHENSGSSSLDSKMLQFLDSLEP
ncbi:unnamed protein product [Protopolystoma xenopodis]|uniref:Uncharacterized protein n=1 Tax=Protopolystoma xenopodis TaxID=117903 RepID=A0A3S5BUR9_9PLAT|nr:unnamed protein product [Protopolystoma xenopodis]